MNDAGIATPSELVHGLLHQGTKGVLASGSKAGKTWLLLHLALCVATGEKFFRWETSIGKVLFVNLEIQAVFIKERLSALMNRLGINDSKKLHFWNLRGKVSDFETLVSLIGKETEGKDYGLIIIDPIYKLMGGKSENGAGSVGTLCNQMERIAEKSGAAVVYSHHFAKGDAKKKTPLDRMSGSGVFARDADTIITLTEHTETDCYTVETVLRNLPKQNSFVVQWEYPVMVEREDLDPEDVELSSLEDADDHGMAEILKAGPLASSEWQLKSMELGLSRATFYRIKAKLKDMGYVKFDFKTKTWTLANTPEAECGDTNETFETNETQNQTN